MQKTLHFGRKRVNLPDKQLGSKIFRILMPIKGLCNKKIKEVKEAKVKEAKVKKIKEQRNIMIKRNLHNLPYIPTSHGAGMKRVLIANEETESKITQIAITELTHGTTIDEHVHPDMDEYFYIIEKEPNTSCTHRSDQHANEAAMIVIINETVHECAKDDIIYVPAGSRHRIEVFSDVTIMTIGVER